MRCSYCGKENKPMSLKEYMQDMKDTEPKGHMKVYTGNTESKEHIVKPWHAGFAGGHTAHAGLKAPKWQVGSAGPKEQAGPTIPVEQGPPVPKEKEVSAEFKGAVKHLDCMPGLNMVAMAMISPTYFWMHAEPITEYSCVQAKTVGTRNAMMEAALLGLLVGMGCDHEQAHMIMDRWKKNL